MPIALVVKSTAFCLGRRSSKRPKRSHSNTVKPPKTATFASKTQSDSVGAGFDESCHNQWKERK